MGLWLRCCFRHLSTVQDYEVVSKDFSCCGGLVLRSRLRSRRVLGLNQILLKIRRVWGLMHVQSGVVDKRISVGVVRKFGKGVASSGVILVI
ncbi:hypothetical protein AVEN_135533-1 [Araneus ventricosus]|uniref:Uncharacterized protein n=1 Tax=Araneus ventricosus TaxID=182803 RepID=A0A4Y2HEB9_ARAVE|nr:hypothetical protein AVEN_135533-1 [Araneus ventricosus]